MGPDATYRNPYYIQSRISPSFIPHDQVMITATKSS